MEYLNYIDEIFEFSQCVKPNNSVFFYFTTDTEIKDQMIFKNPIPRIIHPRLIVFHIYTTWQRCLARPYVLTKTEQWVVLSDKLMAQDNFCRCGAIRQKGDWSLTSRVYQRDLAAEIEGFVHLRVHFAFDPITVAWNVNWTRIFTASYRENHWRQQFVSASYH